MLCCEMDFKARTVEGEPHHFVGLFTGGIIDQLYLYPLCHVYVSIGCDVINPNSTLAPASIPPSSAVSSAITHAIEAP